MAEAEGAARQAQNYAEIHFDSRDGDQIMEPLKIFRAISEEYRIALPILSGYVLVNRPQNLTRTMTTDPAIIKLIYGKIGSLHVYHGLTDMTGELIPLHNGDRPDTVASVKLPDVDDQHRYYAMDDEGIGDQIKDPSQYQPDNPTAKTSLVSLTDAEKQKVDRMERELSEGGNENILNIDDLKSELEKPLTESESTGYGDDSKEQPQDAASQENAASELYSTGMDQVPSQPQQQAQPQSSEPSTLRPQSSEHQPTPITLLAQALSLICKSLEEAEGQQEIADLAESAHQLLATIRTLTKLNN